MTNSLYFLILRFLGNMNMADRLDRFSSILSAAILVVAILSCFFGYKLFRFISAVAAFLLTANGISLLLGPTAERAVVVTSFIILGLIAAFLAYQWKEFGAFILCASIGFGLATLVTNIFWIQLLSAVLLGVLSILFPVSSIILATAIWGGVTLGTDGAKALGMSLIHLRVMILIGFCLLGIGIQYNSDREPIHEEISLAEKMHGKRRTSGRKTPRKGSAKKK